MALESTGLEERLRSLLYCIQSEAGVPDRMVYKQKNQHCCCPSFQSLLNVRRDVRLLLYALPEEVFNNLFLIIDGKMPVHKAHMPKRLPVESIATLNGSWVLCVYCHRWLNKY